MGHRREDSTLGFARRRHYHGSTRGKSSLRLWLPYRVSPVHHRDPGRDRLRSRWSTPSEVSSPSAFLSHEEPLSPAGTHPAGCVASSGFCTLSTLCSPHGLPGLFHPGSAHGVLPFEALLLAWCRTSSRTPCPSLGFSSSLAKRGRPFRDSCTKRSTSAGLGISQVAAANAPLGFPASRLLALGSEGRS